MPKTISRKEQLKNRVTNLKKRSASLYRTYSAKTTEFVRLRPFRSMVIVFVALLVLLILGQALQPKTEEKTAAPTTKVVRVYGIGEAPKATFQGKVEREGVVKIMAQTSGIVSQVSVKEGESVGAGQQLISLGSNYQGGNASSVQRQIAQSQYQNILDTFGTQKDLIQDQKNVATASADDANRQREISRKSNDDTRSQIDIANSEIDQISDRLDQLSADNPDDAAQIAQLEGQRDQLRSGLLQLQSSQRTLDYQGNNDNPPAKIADFQKNIAIRQLDVQDRALNMNKEVTQLQLSLAYITESNMYPASPFAGKVERVFVHPGQSVSPGTLLATVSQSDPRTTVIVNVPQQVAKLIAQGEPSTLTINNKKVAITPYYVSSVATDGLLYSVFFDIPEEKQDSLTDGEYISIDMPVDTQKTTGSDPLLPIDAVYQTQDSAYVLVVANKKAETKKVKLGDVFGGFVEVISGIDTGDQVILDRNVVAGDKVKVY